MHIDSIVLLVVENVKKIDDMVSSVQISIGVMTDILCL